MESLTLLQSFLPKLLAKSEQLHLANLSNDKEFFQPFFIQLIKLDKERQEYVKTHASDFNIFGIMRYGHYETRLHTPFLVHLLSAQGSHQIGSQFFNLFIHEVYPEIEVSEITRVEVIEELPFQFSEEDQVNTIVGRIDIYIEFLYNNTPYFIAVENKINAPDQEKQLSRYYRFLSLHSNKNENIRLIYLTKYGTMPVMPRSIEREDFYALSDCGILKRISYSKHIAGWLIQLMEANNPDIIKHTLKQYIQTLKKM